MKAKPTRQDCQGCYNDIYNHNNMGANLNKDGKPECWSFQDATFVVAYDIHKNVPPPYLHLKKTKRPSCFRQQNYCRVKPEALTKDGYWR